jgi:hypothetical protein
MIDEEFRCDVCDISAERDKLKAERDELKTELKAAVQLCRIYFNIACELGGEETVRHKRDNAIKEIQEADK